MFDSEKEVREAIQFGEMAFDSLNLALKELDGAKTLGIFDIIGGGLIVSAFKRKRMNTANSYIKDGKRYLVRFNKELNDVSGFEELEIEIDDFVMVSDIIFDNIFSDLATQKKINDAIKEIHEIMDKIEVIIDALERMLG